MEMTGGCGCPRLSLPTGPSGTMRKGSHVATRKRYPVPSADPLSPQKNKTSLQITYERLHQFIGPLSAIRD